MRLFPYRTYFLTICSIPIHERVELPESWIPADSRVEIDAKITAGMLLSFIVVHICSPAILLAARSLILLFLVRLLHQGTPNDGRGAVSCAGQVVGGVSLILRPSLGLDNHIPFQRRVTSRDCAVLVNRQVSRTKLTFASHCHSVDH